ncbi:polysaccharide biosynthesis tyrosine autokinase [Mesorhizobium xinjiangense]|uniref:polysaccharide biosynthesis tyrosine autokinase n=1 Tax=Mesorhizobium xinjiangense TaxID=2678685 RepID=UPI0012EE1C98
MHQRTIPLNSTISSAPEEADQFIDLDRLFAIVRRQWKLVALGAVLGMALGVTYLLFTPPIYTAATRILIDENLAKLAQDDETMASRLQADSMILSEVEILKSARLASVVVDAEGLDENEAFLNPPQAPLAWAKDQVKSLLGLVSADRELTAEQQQAADKGRAVALLQNALHVERVGRSFVINLAFSSNDPVLAGSITRAYADAYLSDQLEANFDATERATVWMQGRLDHLQESSQAAALEVERFRAEHGLTAARGELLSEQQLSDLNSQLVLARAETANARARYEQYKSIIDSGPENAVENATIPADRANSAALANMKERYLAVTKREQDIVDRFDADHPQAVSLRREQQELTKQIYQELSRLTESYRNEYEVARAREQSLAASLGEMAGDSSEDGQALVKLRELEQKATALATLYQNFLARYEETSQQRTFPIAKARVISAATNPTVPSSPRKSLSLAFSLVLGLFAGAGVAALQEFRERFFRTAEDVRSALDANFLGHLPLVPNAPDVTRRAAAPADAAQGLPAPWLLQVAVNAPGSSFAETLRNAKLAADVVLHNQPCKVIAFASVLPHEGKTTVAANFAGLLAASGARTLLVDGDLRNPGLSRAYALTAETGLVDAVLGEQRWQSLVKVDRKTRLAILPAASRRRLSHTSELISGSGMRDLLEDARNSFHYVVVDLPPLAPVIDAKAFAPLADGFVLVAEWGQTPRALVRSSLQDEPQIAAKLLGVMLNKTDMKKLTRYGVPGGFEQYLDRYSGYYTETVDLNAKG